MFEHSLIGLEARKKSRRGWFSLPVAIAIHLVAVAGFTFAGVWDVAEVPDPSTAIEPFISVTFTPPPPPPPPRGSGQPETRTAVKPPEVKTEAPRELVQPPDVPDELPPVVTQATGDVVSDLPAGGHPDGVDEGGVDGGDPYVGVPFSTGKDPVPGVGRVEPQPANDEPIVVGGAVKKPEILVKTQPRYTELARRANIEGVVILKAVIDERGYVTDLQVIKTLPMGLDDAAMDAVRTWRFKPATLHDRAVKVYYNLTVNFQIQR